jgi:DNA-binding response OmpR family regulator
MRPNSERKILIIEDDGHIAEGLKLNLSIKGYEVHIAQDGFDGLRQWRELGPDLIVLDIMLPGIDGISILRNIRLADERIPILILSAKAAPDDRIEGLTHGVDDYLAKPFHLEEFLLRVERLFVRESFHEEPGIPGDSTMRAFTFGGNRIDFVTATAVSAGGSTIRLTEQEMKLLKLLILNRGKPLTRGKLLEIGWGCSGRIASRTVDNFIVRFRKYFEKDPKNPAYFKSLRSVGYYFDGEATVNPPGP